jgi:uncharacterized membrane protein
MENALASQRLMPLDAHRGLVMLLMMGRENHLLLLDCRSRETELVPMSDPSFMRLSCHAIE